MLTNSRVKVASNIELLEKDILEIIIKDSVELIEDMIEAHTVKGNHLSNLSLWQELSNLKDYNEKDKVTAKLNILPLERVGAEQGKSGSKVMICYFTADNINGPSEPFVLKYYKTSGGRDKLKDEKNNYKQIGSCFINKGHRFSRPIRYHNYNGTSILWSPFINVVDHSKYNDDFELGEYNLWKLLNYKGEKHFYNKSLQPSFYGKFDEINILKEVYENMNELHNHKVTHIPRTYEKEYKWYLKGFDTWGKIWNYNWSPDQINIFDFNDYWINPVCIYKEYKQLDHNFRCAAIHGDLHPRNIVVGHDGSPYVIDYGWSQKSAHIMKDFVLMECNLRFMILQPEISFWESNTLSAWLDTTKKIKTTSEYIKKRAELISILRKIAIDNMGGEFNLVEDYLLPMFFVSIGLLRHFSIIQNQIAAKLTILHLARYIHNHYKDKI